VNCRARSTLRLGRRKVCWYLSRSYREINHLSPLATGVLLLTDREGGLPGHIGKLCDSIDVVSHLPTSDQCHSVKILPQIAKVDYGIWCFKSVVS
jgi:hypothetical protein